jgi:uncharacterized membrane protein YkvA (DUF1232 family)
VDVTTIVAIVVGVLLVWAALVLLFWLLRPKDVGVRELVRVVPDLLRLLKDVITDRQAPLDVRVVLVGLFAWIVSPIDLIPDFIPVIGPLDDVVVAVVALRYTRRRMGAAALQERWRGTVDGFALLTRVIGRE